MAVLTDTSDSRGRPSSSGAAPKVVAHGFLEALNGLFQAAKRRARGFTRLSTIRTVIFMIAGKLDFAALNSHAP